MAAPPPGPRPPRTLPTTRSTISAGVLIERTFGETRRRVKVIGRLPGESSCLSLVWAVLDRASRWRPAAAAWSACAPPTTGPADWFPGSWPGLTMTPRALRLLQDLRSQLLHPPADKEVIDEAVTAAA
jgi:putative transposase